MGDQHCTETAAADARQALATLEWSAPSFLAMATMACAAAFAPLQSLWGRPLPSPAARPACQRRCLLTTHAAEQQAVPSSTAADPAPGVSVPPPPPATSKADSLPPERLKQLRRDGLALKDVIKMGRRGPAEGLASQVRQRWNTSEVSKAGCTALPQYACCDGCCAHCSHASLHLCV